MDDLATRLAGWFSLRPTTGPSLANTRLAKNKKKLRVEDHDEPRNFLFGYGSLMCPQSRAITVPNLDPFAQPVIVHDVERMWTARTKSGMTAMGVRFREGANCTGVLLEVTEEQLEQFDKREKNYDRVKVELENVEQIPFLPDEANDDNHAVFEAKLSDAISNVFVWIYVQKRPLAADDTHPIAQSYVDIILRGCLSVSEAFARSFIDTTHGWDSDHPEGNWVDDRHDPIYVRADPEYSKEKGEHVDQLLREHHPEAIGKRKLFRRKKNRIQPK